MFCKLCGGWTQSQGHPRLLAGPCKGRQPMGARIIRAVARDEPPRLMKFEHGWPQANNNPTIG
eukprot:7524880-Karenia_brevis.AAC.1